MSPRKSQCLSDLAALLYAAEVDSERHGRVSRTLSIVSGCDERWWDNIGEGKSAEDLIAYFNQSPRRLPAIPYEEMP